MVELSLDLIAKATRNPRRALLWLLFGKETYFKAYGPLADTCNFIPASTMLEEHMSKLTAIHEHLATLYMLTLELGLKSVLELGTYAGESTIALLWAARQINGRVVSVDKEPCLEAKKLVDKCGLGAWWEFEQRNDLELFWNRPIDHLFIDTSHTYAQTLAELAKFEPYVVPGGIITMHDAVNCVDVLKAVRDYTRGRIELFVHLYRNNNGLAVIFKRKQESKAPD